MVRLILEEGGKRRAFKLHAGRLTIGSGQDCTLTLTASDVAEVHAELEVAPEGILLVPRPGVVPPTVLGRPVTRPTKLSRNAEFRIGAAVFRLAADEPDGPAASAVRSAAGDRLAARTARRSAQRAGVERARAPHQVKRGLPVWAILLIFVALVPIAYVVARGWAGQMSDASYNPHERLRVATVEFEGRAIKRAEDELKNVDLTLAPELKPQVDELRRKIAAAKAEAEVDAWNIHGTKVFDTQIEGFVKKRLLGDNVPRERARVFIKRCEDFKKKWPQHPKIEWINRYQARYASIAKMEEPPTFTDVAYEVETLTWAKPRYYDQAFALLDDFERNASPQDYDACVALRDEMVREREEYFIDRMQQAKWHWERGQKNKDSTELGRSVEVLVQIIIWIGDADMAAKAAKELVHLESIDEWLRGYQKDLPEKFELLIRQPEVRDLALSLKLL